MNNLYDNGYKMIGTKKDIFYQILNNMLEEENDEEYMEILEDIKNYDDEDIIMLDYDNPMGITIEIWKKEDILEIK